MTDITAYLFGILALILLVLYWYWNRRKVERFEKSYRADRYPEDESALH
ncbi:MAG: hypothetical protein JRN68_07080 [Nitrososphaerota archaeon]|nr:hypothetical protein [Nitrososphaerota archaeon]